MALIMSTTLAFCLGDLETVLGDATGEPFLAVFFNATKSKSGTNTMAAVVVIMLIISCVSGCATASRQLWSFARDRGLPASDFLAHVNPKLNVPIRAVAVSASVTGLLSLINIGSSAAFNAVNSLGVLAILCSYFLTIGCLIHRRLFGAPLPPRRWSLGKWGLPINIVSVMFLIPLIIFDVWPLHRHVTTENMNWSSVIATGVCLVAGIFYVFKGRKQYDGPVVLVKRDI
ncbi:MAG: hypothetical protein M1820_004766 [Bogoriella megaspora]|nr:MAG: hypothetical protein M1820_004766 [Bogoriella megaspora]